MPVSVHIPRELLIALDRRAKKLGLTRSGFVARAVEHELAVADRWSPGFLEHLRGVTDEQAGDVDALLRSIVKARTRKGAPKL
ncbi:MAG: ribbon-helix-helix protein, CopG family [Myxococcaceae bacterium]